MKKSFKKLIAIALTVFMLTGVLFNENLGKNSAAAAGTEDKYVMHNLTAFQIVNDMGPGWNLGNTFEANGGETSWGNPKTTKAMIKAIADKGFTTLRIPVRWDKQYLATGAYGKYTIKSAYFDRIEEVANYALDEGMYVIINIHHNDIQSKVSTNKSTQTAVKNEMSSVWTQIAKRFEKYGDKLIFETINEPRYNEDWVGNANYYSITNEYNEAARAAIRATGGNNATRLIMMPTYCASGDAPKMEGWKKLAKDDYVAVSIHAYLPFDFAFNGSGHTTWKDSDDAELQAFFDRIDKNFVSKGIPVVIGEFGSRLKGFTSTNLKARVTCADAYARYARQFGAQDIPVCWWDNGVASGDYKANELFGIFNRRTLNFVYDGTSYEGIADSIINAYNGDPDYEVSTEGGKVLFSGSKAASAWGQAYSYEGSLLGEMSSADKIVLTLKSSGQTELVIQGPNDWLHVPASSHTTDSSGKWTSATFTYADILKVYNQLSSKSWVKFYIGACNDPITLTKAIIDNGTTAHTHTYDGEQIVTIEPTAATCGRAVVKCSVQGCSAEKVIVLKEDSRSFDICDETTGEKVSQLEMPTESTYKLMAKIDNIKSHVVWSSSDEKIATVDENGVVSANKYGKVTITARTLDGILSRKISIQTRFRDVVGNGKKGTEGYLYYYTPVYWAADNKITNGYDGVYFGVGNTCTRLEFAIFAWRVAGAKTPKYDANKYFSDMGEYAASSTMNKAVAWAYENGIVKGYPDGTYGINNEITRLESMIMLYRLAGKPAVSGTVTFSDCGEFAKTSDSYKSVLWGLNKGITGGYEDGSFGVNDPCLREQIVTFLYRYKSK